MKTNLYILFLFCFLAACSNSDSNKEVIASVYDKKLYRGDIKHLFDNVNYDEDSIKITEQFINKWTEEQVLLHHAESVKTIEIEDINRKTEHYKNTLIIHQFENDYINKHLDTVISEKEIITYHKSHKNDFQLNDYLVKVLYIKVPFDAPDIPKIDKLYALRKENDINKIEEYAKLYATNFYFDDENWIYFDELTKEIPLKNINKDKFIIRKSKVKIEEEYYYYYLNVIDYKLKNTVSPLDFERDNIKQRILNKRIKELRENIRTDYIQKANNEKAIKKY